MQIGMVGLGKMGGNMSRRLMKAGHQCVVYARTAKTREALAKDGATAAASIADLVKELREKPRAVLVDVACGKGDGRDGGQLGRLCWIGTISSSTAATHSTRTTSATPKDLRRRAFATSIAARQVVSGVSSVAIA
jgi:hypothetical protein